MIHCLCKELWPLENSKEIWPYAAPGITSQITGNLIVYTIYHLLMFRNVFSSQQYIILIKIGVRIKSHFLEIFNFIHCQLSLLTPTWHQAAMFLWAWSNLWCHTSVAYYAKWRSNFKSVTEPQSGNVAKLIISTNHQTYFYRFSSRINLYQTIFCYEICIK